MARTAKTFADKLEEHMFRAPLTECRDIVKHAQMALRMREQQTAIAVAETVARIENNAKATEKPE